MTLQRIHQVPKFCQKTVQKFQSFVQKFQSFGQKIVIFQPITIAILFVAKELFMPHPAFFELSRVVGTPLYINAHRVTSVDFIGTDEEGYVAFIAMDTLTKEQSHYAWGEARALEAMFSKHTFGSHVRFDNCCKPRNSFTKHTIRQQGWGAFR